MINGMMTLSGAWHKLRDDPILRFLVVSLAFYGMSTFEGPMMAIKTVNALAAQHRRAFVEPDLHVAATDQPDVLGQQDSTGEFVVVGQEIDRLEAERVGDEQWDLDRCD